MEAREDFKRCLELDEKNIPCKNELEKLDRRIEELQVGIYFFFFQCV